MEPSNLTVRVSGVNECRGEKIVVNMADLYIKHDIVYRFLGAKNPTFIFLFILYERFLSQLG